MSLDNVLKKITVISTSLAFVNSPVTHKELLKQLSYTVYSLNWYLCEYNMRQKFLKASRVLTVTEVSHLSRNIMEL